MFLLGTALLRGMMNRRPKTLCFSTTRGLFSNIVRTIQTDLHQSCNARMFTPRQCLVCSAAPCIFPEMAQFRIQTVAGIIRFLGVGLRPRNHHTTCYSVSLIGQNPSPLQTTAFTGPYLTKKSFNIFSHVILMLSRRLFSDSNLHADYPQYSSPRIHYLNQWSSLRQYIWTSALTSLEFSRIQINIKFNQSCYLSQRPFLLLSLLFVR